MVVRAKGKILFLAIVGGTRGLREPLMEPQLVKLAPKDITRGSGIPWTSVGFVRHLRRDG